MAAERAKTYKPEMPTTWWIRNPRYFLYMLREVTSIFVFLYALAFAVQFLLLADRGLFDAFREIFASPVFRAFTGVVLVMAFVHALTWWSLNAQVFQIRIGGRPLPKGAKVTGFILAWAVVSGLVYFLVFVGLGF